MVIKYVYQKAVKHSKFAVDWHKNQKGGGLPDFSWSKHTKTGKNIPNYYKLYQIAWNLPKGS
jgi:hypothetical protein